MFDIMLPFYGRMDHAHDAIRSIVAQTDPDWRLVVIDDAYPDDSLGAWIAELGDDRIEFMRNTENAGISATFQRCIDLARAEYVVIMGCDDIMLPGYLAHMRGMIAGDPTAAFYHAGTEIIDADGKVVRTIVDTAKAYYRPRVKQQTAIGGETLATSLLRGAWTNFPAIVWRRDVIAPIGFDQRFITIQDVELMMNILVGGGHLSLDETLVFQYRRHASSVSSFRAVDGSRFVEEAAYFAHTAQRMTDLGWRRAARAARVHFSSRINAALKVPTSLLHRDMAATRTLLSYAFR